MAVLHVTSGAAVAGDLATLGEEVLTWDDVLDEGPLLPQPPEPLRETRARFLADAGLADLTSARARLAARDARLDAVDFSTKLVLWFGADLRDQLQLVQILDRLATGAGALRRSRPLGPVQHVRLPPGPRTFVRDRLARAASLTEDDHRDACAVWTALTAPDPHALPTAWLALTEPSRRATNLVADLAPALHRLLEEHPWTTDGLSRTERELLVEPWTALVDPVLRWRAARLEPALLTARDGAYALTDAGRAVLDRRQDAVDLLAPLDRWVGGVHHRTIAAARYDPATRRLAA